MQADDSCFAALLKFARVAGSAVAVRSHLCLLARLHRSLRSLPAQCEQLNPALCCTCWGSGQARPLPARERESAAATSCPRLRSVWRCNARHSGRESASVSGWCRVLQGSCSDTFGAPRNVALGYCACYPAPAAAVMDAQCNDDASSLAHAADKPAEQPCASSYQMHGKNIVRISPALLGRIGETARLVTEGSLVRLCPPALQRPAVVHAHVNTMADNACMLVPACVVLHKSCLAVPSHLLRL